MSSCCAGSLELSHELAVKPTCGGEVLVAIFESQSQVDDLLLEGGDALLELADAGGCAESCCVLGLFAGSSDRRISSS